MLDASFHYSWVSLMVLSIPEIKLKTQTSVFFIGRNLDMFLIGLHFEWFGFIV